MQTLLNIGVPGVGLVYRQENGTFYWIMPDHLGSTRMIVDEVGTVQELYSYEVYGAPTKVTVASSPVLKYYNLYTGQYYDEELELYNYHARFYDPSIARFLQVDPVHQFYNPYSYVGGVPNLATDPSGMASGQSIAAIFLGAVAVIGSIAATIVTAGGATPLLVGSIIGFGMGAGVSSISYAATHMDDNVYESGGFWADLGISAGFGGLGGGAGTGIAMKAGWTTIKKVVLDVALNTALGALDGYISNGISNSISNESFNKNYESSTGYGALGGFSGSIFLAGLSRGVKGIRARNRRRVAPVPINDTPGDILAQSTSSSLRPATPSFVHSPAPRPTSSLSSSSFEESPHFPPTRSPSLATPPSTPRTPYIRTWREGRMIVSEV